MKKKFSLFLFKNSAINFLLMMPIMLFTKRAESSLLHCVFNFIGSSDQYPPPLLFVWLALDVKDSL
jgi:hypothetical protein